MNLILVLLTGLGWGLLSVGSKALFAASPAIDGTSLAVARAAWALPMFLVILGVVRRLERPRLDARRGLLIVAAAFCFGPFVTLLFSVAAAHTSVAHISFLIGISPVTNTAIAALVFRTALDRRGLLALAIGVAAVALLALSLRGDASGTFGDLLMLGWLAAFAGYACCLRAVGPGISATALMGMVGALSMLFVLVPGLASGHGGAIAHIADTPAAGGWFFGEVVLGSTLIAQTAYAAAVRRLGVSVATIGAEYTALAVGTAASLVLHERWSPLTVAAGVLLCVALGVTFAPARTREAGMLAA